MGDKTAIEWTATVHPDGSVTPGATWNPVRGCIKVSPGCAHCYAETFAERFRGVAGHPYEQGFDLRLVPEKLTDPLRWTKPRRVFVNSMSDLFQDGVPDEFIDQVFGVMAIARDHTFQVLTKRPQRMLDYMAGLLERHEDNCQLSPQVAVVAATMSLKFQIGPKTPAAITAAITGSWPLPNVWLGVSVENQHFAEERIPLLLRTPAAIRFVSYEPALGPVDFLPWMKLFRNDHLVDQTGVAYNRLDWVIVGGESGAGARPFDVAWARAVVEAGRVAGVPVFVKQLGAKAYGPDIHSAILHHKKGGEMAEWPADLQVREFP